LKCSLYYIKNNIEYDYILIQSYGKVRAKPKSARHNAVYAVSYGYAGNVKVGALVK